MTTTPTITPDLETLRRQVSQLSALHDEGALDAEHYRASRDRLEKQIVERVMAGDVNGGATLPATGSASGAAAVHAASAAGLMLATDARTRTGGDAKLPLAHKLGVAAFAFAVAVGGYLWKGSPALLSTDAPAVTARAATPGHATDAAQIEAMVGKLRERLDADPSNADGWGMLARSYTVLGRADEAVAAYAKAVALVTDDAALMADYADALALRDGRRLDGEAATWIAKALAINPDQPKALALAGTAAFERQDYASAVKAWERAVERNPDHPLAGQLRGAIDDARDRAGMPPAVAPAAGAAVARTGTPATVKAPHASSVSGEPAQVSGRVSLSPALAAKAGPDDTVFVFARAAEGSRMPLAIVRKKVKDLPFDFTLDDAMAMSPQAKLSAVSKLVVGARVSKGGDAAPQPGDLQGQVGPVDLGAKNIDLMIAAVVER